TLERPSQVLDPLGWDPRVLS
nr:cytochrome P-450 25-hydroxyvitamin D3 1 alpha-hydroxylase, 1 alpha-hydroxylase [chickens, kidney, Peptide Mitochondrial Partial, 20 aa] [Gallus gallus]